MSGKVGDIDLIGKPRILEVMPMDYFLAFQRINKICDRDTCIKLYKRILTNREIIYSKQYCNG